ncbi:hypothetical protein K2173_003078 [Erythroxylum novogranatense]|uniref:Receptor-like serine/threonine-protein kinase n=1 Tax=Erythroxylum novogranatense TaxID=1862640 RepID=A0AAV8TB83_9ROSI|nr:hypothetical protein K2173_003078 [Erythroxylum novogranatense]
MYNMETELQEGAIQMESSVLLVFAILLSSLKGFYTIDTLYPGQSMKDGNTLISADGGYELGFFSPADSKHRYLGLWYKKSPQTIVWVANRDIPASNSLGALNFTSQGLLLIVNNTNGIVWQSNTTRAAQSPIAHLLDSGNLIVREGNDSAAQNFLWQGFDYPCDTILPGLKIGRNLVTGHDWFLQSWKSTEDPGRGQYFVAIDIHGYPQVFIRNGAKVIFRAGSWDGLRLTGVPRLMSTSTFTFEFVMKESEIFFKFELNSTDYQRYTLNPSGLLQRFTWSERTNDWVIFATTQADQCDFYGLCGANSSCNINNYPVCSCLKGFLPNSPNDWGSQTWSEGCGRRTPLSCNDTDGFVRLANIKLPDTSSSRFNKSIDLMACKSLCLKNCSCSAYSSLDISHGGNGCLLWFGNLTDLRVSIEGGQDLYVRVAASELDENEPSSKKKRAEIIAGTVLSALTLLILGMICYAWRRNVRRRVIAKENNGENDNSERRKEDMELPIFNMTTITDATDKFSIENKLGEGGFGPVYKGTLIEGQEIAVKRLSQSSGQGLNEFKNEVILISKLQHRNLVKLLGCCIHEDERMLIYEYMPNKSLDSFIFDQTRSTLLDWKKRDQILCGIARGLLYLHQDSRLRIIHRDLKASNILLDNQMNPKISDFGLARTFGADQTQANTNRVVGTFGYMSPEYAVDGMFSVKSDVFSFGVLVLEIVSGRRNRGFCHPGHDLNLLGHAWMLWNEGTPMELLDKCFVDSANLAEVIRCIHVALLCVQQRPEDRPNMSTVVLMLGSENPLPEPKQPGFFTGRNPAESDSSNKQESLSANEITMTLSIPR